MKKKTRQTAFPAVDAHIGARLRLKRLSLRWSRDTLAREIGVSHQQIYKYEVGENQVCLSRAIQLAKALGVSVAYFCEGLDVEDAPAGAAVPLLPEFLRTPGANTLVNAYAGLTRAASRRLVLSIARGALEIEGSVE